MTMNRPGVLVMRERLTKSWISRKRSPVAAVVITTRDRPDMVARAVASALRQSVREVEVIVVDDGSSPPVAAAALARDDRVVLIRHEKSRGVCAARNSGLAAARAPWITFLDDDDELVLNMLERSLEVIERSDLPPPVAALSGIQVVDRSGSPVERWFPVTMPRGRDFFLEGSQEGTFRATNTLVASTQLVRDIGGWDERMRSAERHDFFLRLNAVCSLDATREVCYRMTAHDGARTSKNAMDYATDMQRTVKKHLATFRRHPRRFAHFLGSMGILYLKAGRWGAAVSATTRALPKDPKRLKLYRWWVASLAGPRPLAWYRRSQRRPPVSALGASRDL